MTSRLQAAKILLKLIQQKKTLSFLKNDMAKVDIKNKALVQELCYGVARWYYRLTFIANYFLQKPLRIKDQDIYILILIGLYQLLFTRIPPHAALSETVLAARGLKKEWGTKLINGILRNFLKKEDILRQEILEHEEAFYAHPFWLIKKIKDAWPANWRLILETNNEHPPQCLRINQRKVSREHYLKLLEDQQIKAKILPLTQSGVIVCKPVDVTLLPGFNAGWVFIQDGSAQLAAELLMPCEGERILDACAAPGGKTSHILQIQPKLDELVAVDNDSSRLEKLRQNLSRLQLTAKIICQDITCLDWWDGKLFDRILLDAPCSATGVIKRHPDIKLLRTPQDIPLLTNIQLKALTTMWQLLKTGGTLLYVTCSILPEENEQIIQTFIDTHEECQVQAINTPWGLPLKLGRQILPGMHLGMDGFYFAKLKK